MRRAFLAFACVALLAAPPALAQAPPSNGMLAAVVDSKLVTVNADGSGQRTLWAPGSGEISGLAWSPDGNRLAMAYGGRIVVYDVAAGRGVTLPLPADAQYANPSWSADGQRLGFRAHRRRGAGRVHVGAGRQRRPLAVRARCADVRSRVLSRPEALRRGGAAAVARVRAEPAAAVVRGRGRAVVVVRQRAARVRGRDRAVDRAGRPGPADDAGGRGAVRAAALGAERVGARRCLPAPICGRSR